MKSVRNPFQVLAAVKEKQTSKPVLFGLGPKIIGKWGKTQTQQQVVVELHSRKLSVTMTSTKCLNINGQITC